MYKPVTRRGIRDTDLAIRHTTNVILNSSEYAALPSDLQRFIDNQLVGPARINYLTPSSALPARRLMAQAFQSSAQLHFNDLLGRNPEPYLGTFSFRNGEVGIGHRLRNVQTTFLEVSAALEHFGLEGVVVPDIDILLPAPDENPIIAFHLHGLLVGSGGQNVRLKRTSKKIEKAIGWESRLPKAVNLRGKLPGDLRLHAENIATYSAKLAAAPKEPYEVNGNERWNRKRAAYSTPLALGFLHAWSQIPLLRFVQPVGAFGESFHATWLRKMRRVRNVGIGRQNYAPHQISANWSAILARIPHSGTAQ